MTRHQPAYLADAFPESLRVHALGVVALLPAPSHLPEPQDTIGPITLDGRPIRIPFRIYSAELDPSVCATLTPLERSIAACLYTRHHDGRVRERALEYGLKIGEVWSVPFVIQLLGEYVIEIVEKIVIALTQDEREPYVAFSRENERFIDLTEQRATSYWNAYFRRRFPQRQDYPALAAINALRTSVAAPHTIVSSSERTRDRELYERGRELLVAKRFAEAADALSKSASASPHFKTLELLGECYVELGRLQDAIVPLAAAVGLNRQSRAPALLAEVFERLGRKHDARAMAKVALERSDANRRARKVLERLEPG